MSQSNIEKTKVPDPNNMTKYQPKKEYSLRSKHNTKNAAVSKISLSGERVLQTMPNKPNLLANDRYDQADSQFGRYGYDHQEHQNNTGT